MSSEVMRKVCVFMLMVGLALHCHAEQPVEIHDKLAESSDADHKHIALTLDACSGKYDEAAAAEIRRMGYQIAGFSVNADQGATLRRNMIAARIAQVKGGDVIIAHMNKPASDTAEGLSDSLLALLRKGLVFVRLDQVALQQLPDSLESRHTKEIKN